MNMIEVISNHFSESIQAKIATADALGTDIAAGAQVMLDALLAGNSENSSFGDSTSVWTIWSTKRSACQG